MKKNKPSIVFMGTPEFAVPTLESVHAEFGVKCVVTVPDRQKGRGRKTLPSPVKSKALELGIPVLQPDKLKDQEFIEKLKSYDPDITLVLAFRILPNEILSIAKLATFNIHGSLLPRYRGAAPINRAVMNGDTETGLTSFVIKQKVDTGDVLLQTTVKIPENSTATDLHDILMPISAKMGVDTINLLMSGNYTLMPQDNSKASPAPKLFREDCQIKWSMHARDLRNFINGVSTVPGAWTYWDDKKIKILRVEYCSSGNGEPGNFEIDSNGFNVYSQKGYLRILELQMPGKKKMDIISFLAGYRGEKRGKFSDRLS